MKEPAMIKTRFKPELIAQFWQSVHQILCTTYGMDSDRAWESINVYRAQLEHFGVGEIVYHNDPEDIAENLGQRANL
ncbi:MAG: hypothetical protein WD768_13925 [Phycisphaeraceae bacterium]